MNIIKVVYLILYLTNDKQIQDNTHEFVKRQVYTKTEIVQNDKFSCDENYLTFYKETLMSKFGIEFDQIDIKCLEKLDHKGILYTKRFITLYV